MASLTLQSVIIFSECVFCETPAHVVQWLSHSYSTCGRAWRARSPLFGGSIRASVR